MITPSMTLKSVKVRNEIISSVYQEWRLTFYFCLFIKLSCEGTCVVSSINNSIACFGSIFTFFPISLTFFFSFSFLSFLQMYRIIYLVAFMLLVASVADSNPFVRRGRLCKYNGLKTLQKTHNELLANVKTVTTLWYIYGCPITCRLN